MPGEPDQGQYDRTDRRPRRAVRRLASSSATSLVALRGWETTFGDVGADLDLGWRAHELGPPRRRRRRRRGCAANPASPSRPRRAAARRRAARRVALARAPWWAAPPLALWIAVTSVVAALGLLLLKRPRSAWAELSSLASLDPFRGTAARWRTRHRREVGRRDLRALFEPRRAVLTGWGDAVHDALVSPRPPIGDEANDLNPRSWFVKVVRHPGVLAAAGAAGRRRASPVAPSGPASSPAPGPGLAGGELVGNRAVGRHAVARLDRRLDRRRPRRTRPGRAPRAPARAARPGSSTTSRWCPSPASPAGARRRASSSSSGCRSRPRAPTSSFRTMVTSRPVRGLAAFAWATTGVAAASVAQGRLGAVVALVLLPPLASGSGSRDPPLHGDERLRHRARPRWCSARSPRSCSPWCTRWRSSSPWSAAGARAARPRRRRRAPSPVLGTLARPRRPRRRGRCSSAGWGWPSGAARRPQPWQLALLAPGGAGLPARVDRPARSSSSRVARAGPRAGVGHGLDVARPAGAPSCSRSPSSRPRVRLGTVPGGRRGRRRADHAVVRHPAPARSPSCSCWPSRAGSTASACAGPTRPRAARRRHAWRPRVTASARSRWLVGAARRRVGDARHATSPRGATRGRPSRSSRPRAPSRRGPSSSPRATAGAGLPLRRARGRRRRAPPARRGRRRRLGRHPGQRASSVTPRPAPALFADTATDLLAVRAGLVPEVTRRLDATEGLQRIAPRDGWEMWRVSPTGAGGDGLVAPPRLRLETPDRHPPRRRPPGSTRAPAPRVDVPPGQPARRGRAARLGRARDRRGRRRRASSRVAGTATPTYALPARHRATSPSRSTTRRAGGTSRQVVAVLVPRLPRHPLRPARVPGGSAMSRASCARACRCWTSPAAGDEPPAPGSVRACAGSTSRGRRGSSSPAVRRAALVHAADDRAPRPRPRRRVGRAAAAPSSAPPSPTRVDTRSAPGAELTGIPGVPDVAVPAAVTAAAGPAELLPVDPARGRAASPATSGERPASLDDRRRGGSGHGRRCPRTARCGSPARARSPPRSPAPRSGASTATDLRGPRHRRRAPPAAPTSGCSPAERARAARSGSSSPTPAPTP